MLLELLVVWINETRRALTNDNRLSTVPFYFPTCTLTCFSIANPHRVLLPYVFCTERTHYLFKIEKSFGSITRLLHPRFTPLFASPFQTPIESFVLPVLHRGKDLINYFQMETGFEFITGLLHPHLHSHLFSHCLPRCLPHCLPHTELWCRSVVRFSITSSAILKNIRRPTL